MLSVLQQYLLVECNSVVEAEAAETWMVIFSRRLLSQSLPTSGLRLLIWLCLGKVSFEPLPGASGFVSRNLEAHLGQFVNRRARQSLHVKVAVHGDASLLASNMVKDFLPEHLELGKFDHVIGDSKSEASLWQGLQAFDWA